MARYATGTGHSEALGVNSDTASYTEWTVADSGQWDALVSLAGASTGTTSFIGLKTDGSLWGWGANASGVLGLGDSVERITPVQIIASGVAKVAASAGSVYCVKTDGTLWVWGANDKSQLGLGDTTLRATPTQVGSATDWADVAAGNKHAIAKKTAGTLYSCGENTYGATGQGTLTGNTASWTQIGSATDWELIACGLVHCLATKTAGSLWGWGSNNDFQLGTIDDYFGYVSTPAQAWGGETEWLYSTVIVGIAAHDKTSIIWQADGTAHVTGDNAYGRLGVTGASIEEYTEIPTLDVDRVFASGSCTILITLAGLAYGAGSNVNYGLGIAGGSDVSTFTAVPAIDAAVAFASGFDGEASQASVVTIGSVSVPSTLTVSNPAGSVVADMRLDVSESGSVAAAMRLSVIPDIDAAISAGSALEWSALCTIDGVDFSARLTGAQRVTIAEGAARIAEFRMRPPSGTFSPLDYVGLPITFDYVLGGPQRLFTGVIDTPAYDPDSGILTLTCTDDLQNRVAALAVHFKIEDGPIAPPAYSVETYEVDRSAIDLLIGGWYSEDVQGVIADDWDYAQAMMQTVQASLDAGPNGELRVTSWQPSSGVSFGAGRLIYQNSTLSLARRTAIVNEVECTLNFRYPHLRQRNASVGWSGTHIDMAPCGYRYPTQQDIEGAAGGVGWTITGGIYWPAPAAIPHSSGGFIYPREDAIDMAVVHLAQRHAQTVTETWKIRYYAPLSIDINGTISQFIEARVESDFDGAAWESALDIEPLIAGGGVIDYGNDDVDLAARASNARLIMGKIAEAKIVGSHRSSRVTNATPLDASLDVTLAATISTANMSASGKIAEVVHTMDMDTGSAISQFSVAVFAMGGTGSPPAHWPPNPVPVVLTPSQDWTLQVPYLGTNVFGVTPYADGLMGLLINPPETITVEDVPDVGTETVANPFYVAGSYPVQGFRMSMPGVDDADRNPVYLPVCENRWAVAVPEGTLSFTVD